MRAGATAHDLERCGVSAEFLALCRVTLQQLVCAGGYSLRSLCVALKLDWPRLLALRFHVELLRDSRNFPLVDLLREPVRLRAGTLCRHFNLNYDYLTRDLGLDPLTQLPALGFNAPLLVRLGMGVVDLFKLAGESLDDARTFTQNNDLSLSLLKRLTRGEIPDADTMPRWHAAYKNIVAVLSTSACGITK